MWKEIVSFMQEHRVKYIFGCSSIENPSPAKVGKILNYLKIHHFSPPDFRVAPLVGKRYPYQDNCRYQGNVQLPSLLKNYLSLGAWVCGDPAWDKHFNTADLFTLLEVKRLNKNLLRKLLG